MHAFLELEFVIAKRAQQGLASAIKRRHQSLHARQWSMQALPYKGHSRHSKGRHLLGRRPLPGQAQSWSAKYPTYPAPGQPH